MKRFKSSKSIVNWLKQRKVVMFNGGGFTFFYKMIKGKLHTYSRFHKKWVPSCYTSLHPLFLDMNSFYRSKNSEVY